MTNHKTSNTEEHDIPSKRKKVVAAVAQEIVTSEDDDNIADGMDICNIIENYMNQHKQTTMSGAIYTLGETIRNTLLEINEIREQNRERRHRELLQILTRMVQQDSTPKNKMNNSNITNQTYNNSNSNNTTEPNFFESQQFCIGTVQTVPKTSTTETLENNLNVVFDTVDNEQSLETGKMSTKYIKILPKSQTTTSSNLQQLDKIKNINTVKPNNTKEELQKMRAKMLEQQRKKMEDRERKKRELLQLQKM